MANSHKRLNKKPNFKNDLKWKAMQKANFKVLKETRVQ